MSKQQDIDPSRHYVSVVLSSKSKARLLNRVRPHHQNVGGDHVTIVSHPTEDDIARYRDLHGRQVSFHATHHAVDPKSKVQAVRVRGLDHLSDKEHKHVTISTGPSVSAVKSNELLANQKGERLPDWVPLTGTIHFAERLGKK